MSTTTQADGDEVELFNLERFSDFDPEWFTRKIRTQVRSTLDRAKAVALPALDNIDIVLPSSVMRDFFRYFSFKADAYFKYEGMSEYEPGTVLQEDAAGPFSMTTPPYLPGSGHNSFVNADGLIPMDSQVIKNGKVSAITADMQHSRYLNLEPTGKCGNLRISGGSADRAELDGRLYLEAVEFSDFMTSPMNGNFGGEIRLAYYCDGNTRTPVTGGSISGNISTSLNSMKMAAKEVSENGYLGPEFLVLKEVGITAG